MKRPFSSADWDLVELVCFAAAFIVILAIGVASLRSPNRPAGTVALSCLGVSASSNSSSISASIGITNKSDATIVYLVCTPQVKSSAGWSKFVFPLGKAMATLSSGQSATILVTMASSNGESRVPVLWGFNYSVTTTRWQEVREDVIEKLTRPNNPGGRGALYTNYVTNIRP